jgi:ribonuclease HIII
MVSIQGLPPPGISGASQTSKTRKKSKVRPEQSDGANYEPTPVASAIARSIHTMEDAESLHRHVQYDLPEGKSRKALEAYYGVMSQARREELAQMLGVDIYI